MSREQEYQLLAKEVVKAVGGKENVIDVVNCVTRLRFTLKDFDLPNEEEIKKIKGVKGVMVQGGQYQVIIGPTVNQVIEFARAEAQVGENTKQGAPEVKEKGFKAAFNRFFKTIAGCIFPMLGVMVASGIIKGLLTILVAVGALTDTSGTYVMLYNAADCVMYFMPILVGFSCGKMFGCNPYLTAVIGAALLHPDLLTAVASEEGFTFLKIPVQNATYANSFLPVLLASYLASKLEKLAKKFIPPMLQLMFVPTFVLLITVPLSWIVIGPVMNWLSNLVSVGISASFGASPLIGGLLIGAFWQLMVVLGLHYAFLPVLFANFFAQGSDPINGVMGLTVWALIGVCLGYALKQKDPEKKSAGFGSLVSALCGVTEPAIYSIALPNFKLFVSAWIGGGVAGAIAGQLGVRLYNFSGDGLFRIPGMINPEGLDISFYGFLICAPIAAIVSGVLAYIMAPSSEAEACEVEGIAAGAVELKAFCDGKTLPLEEVDDKTFSQKLIGDGIAIEPTDNKVYAPADGKVSLVMDTKHAIGMTFDNGMEALIHIGIDTVKLNGEGFDVKVKVGDTFKTGDALVEFDAQKINDAGFKRTVIFVVTNSDKFENLKKVENCDVIAGDTTIITA